ncbi:2-hydroxy-palmitic acid dioxygenase MPO1-like [Miscanthus floridulus]|uniref:2-hydroxy-palmitic acid dioxygenase MPO1-like n=1 Tax=Miscanthus floridulus TaxID=154761 RepID=UPI0034595F74
MGAKAAHRRGVLDLEAQFAFFRSQHRHPVNAAAHALLSWPILFTNLLILHFLPLPLPLPVSPALALTLAYAAAYVAVDRRAGALAGVLFLAAWAASRALAARLGFALSWKLVLATQLFCWTWQFLGHGLFEKKGPTVSDLPEVFLMEPFLIFLQILNKLFGYEPYHGFCKNVERKMEADLRESRELKERKTT